MYDPSTITNVYGLYALIAVQLFGMIKIFIDRGTTKKQRDEAIEALRTRQCELTDMINDCKSKSDIVGIMQKDIDHLKEGHSNASSSIEKLNVNMLNLQIEVTKVASSMTNLTDNVNKIAVSMERLFDKFDNLKS